MKFKSFFILCFLFCFSAMANEAKIVDLFNPMPQTPSVALVDNVTKPNTFHKSNNLTRIAGSFKKAKGEPLFIKGKVTDAFGVPISNAKIKIWQANSAGKYQDLLKKHDSYIDPSFIMSGEANTDNLGNYEFITIFPGFYDDRAPHINLIISHDDFGVIETEFYFKNHPLNKKDPIYFHYSRQDREMLTADVRYLDKDNFDAGKIAVFNIVMDGIHAYKKY